MRWRRGSERAKRRRDASYAPARRIEGDGDVCAGALLSEVWRATWFSQVGDGKRHSWLVDDTTDAAAIRVAKVCRLTFPRRAPLIF